MQCCSLADPGDEGPIEPEPWPLVVLFYFPNLFYFFVFSVFFGSAGWQPWWGGWVVGAAFV
jgi:hypothetical protein